MMTRLTDDMVKDIICSLDSTDDTLVSLTGMNTLELACDAIGISPDTINTHDIRVGVVPVTSGLGIITRFSDSVAEIIKKLGMEAFVTESPDVAGLAEALSAKCDIIFMADDVQFIAINAGNGRYSNNSFSTAAGYVSALKGAAKGLAGKAVLVLGAGRVGSIAAELIVSMGAEVTIYDIDGKKANDLSRRVKIKVADDVGAALSSHDLIFNASPAPIEADHIREGSIFSSPGIPFPFDDAGLKKVKAVIHDPLNIGVAVMAVQSASFSGPMELNR
ncbi:MAG: 3-methylornithyl-N6-L-lysine dehydrogenase PylD [Candidatus Methanoplasma sp.]|jgi:pyrrolysine biosynthesis protein PylD|nr:3-methylornithyl-N6-L-lysine dehydrogenase PylD [Candidatus Methanoplasma sp.]